MNLILVRKGSWLLVMLLMTMLATAQNIGINTDGSTPNTNAMLDIKSGNKGLLIPRMDSNARKLIPDTKGLLVYDTTTSSFWFNNGSTWQNLPTGAGWLLSGNNGTSAATQFIGTTDFAPLNFKVNNTHAGFISPDETNGNTTLGLDAASLLTTGIFNTAIGSTSLHNNTTGNSNVGLGAQTLLSNTGGNNNTAIGTYTLSGNTTGEDNTATGFNSLTINTTGARNTANGSTALSNNTLGNDNTATGYQSLLVNSTGLRNTAYGSRSLAANSTGQGNTASGYQALSSNTVGDNNIAIGYQSLMANTSGANNVAAGWMAMASNVDGRLNVAYGFSALFNNTGDGNTGIGRGALQTNTTGFDNTAIGNRADVQLTNFHNATAIGANALVDASNKIRLGDGAVTVIEGAVPFTTPSDGRYKFNILENVKGLDFIMQLRPVTYQFDARRLDKQPGNNLTQASYDEAAQIRRTGFIAQEVEKAANTSGYDFSGIIKPKSDKDHYGLSYESFVAPLVKATQELNSNLESLKKQVEQSDIPMLLGKQQQTIETQNKKIEQQDKKLAALQQQIDQLLQLLPSQNKPIK